LKLEPISQVVISDDFTNTIEKIKDILPKNVQIELFVKEEGQNFLVSDANEVIAKAYLSSKERRFLILASISFSEIVQNRLLKIIEEPPKNVEFILITNSKATLLPTIKSRLPINILTKSKKEPELNLDLKNLNLKTVYDFLQTNKNLKPSEAKDILEAIVTKAIKSNDYDLNESFFKIVDKTRLALEVGSPADFVLTTLFLKLLDRKKKRFVNEFNKN